MTQVIYDCIKSSLKEFQFNFSYIAMYFFFFIFLVLDKWPSLIMLYQLTDTGFTNIYNECKATLDIILLHVSWNMFL